MPRLRFVQSLTNATTSTRLSSARSYVNEAARELYHARLELSQFRMSAKQEKTRARLLAISSAFASVYIGYHALPIVSDGVVNSAVYMIKSESAFMQRRGLWRFEFIAGKFFETVNDRVIEKACDKGAFEEVLRLSEGGRDVDVEVSEDAKRCLRVFMESEYVKRIVEADAALMKRVAKIIQ
jgi:hypothetical protein